MPNAECRIPNVFLCRRTVRFGLWPLALGIALLTASLACAAERTITLDGRLDDWNEIERISDPAGDDHPPHHDLIELAICHDDDRLNFLLRVDDADDDYYGNSTRYEQLIVYLDTDNNPDTGYHVGPDGEQIGVEYALVSARRVATESSWEGTLYRGGDPWYGNANYREEAEVIGNVTGSKGLPRPAEREVVHAFETAVPRDAIDMIDGGTIAIMVRAGRSGDLPQTDWLDHIVHYTLPAPTNRGSTQLLSPTLEYRFASTDQGLGLVALMHRKQARSFLRTPDSEGEALFWKIALSNNPADEDAIIHITNNTPAAARAIEHDDAQWTLNWQGVELPDGSALDVKVTCAPGAADGLDDWRIAVTNHSDTYGIYRTYFPVLELGVIGDSGADDTIIMSPAEGRSLRNPIYWGLDIDAPQVNTDIYTDNAAIEMLPEQIDFGGFGAAQPHGLPYPGARGQMQLSAYYEKNGDYYYPDVRPGAGLYMAAHDDAMYPKLFFYTPHPRRGVLLYEVAHYPDDSMKPGLDHAPPYAHVLGGYEGDWFDATQIYRDWAVTARWSQPGPLAERDDVPAWLKDMTVVIRADVKKRDNAAFLDQLAPMRDALAGPIGVQWYNWSAWEKRPDKSGYAFPAAPDGPDGFASIVERIQSQNGYVFPYMNSRVWDPDEPNFDDVEPYIMRQADGTRYLKSWGDARRYAHPCLQTDFWQQYLADACTSLLERYYTKGLYLDQGAEAHFGGTFDYQGCHDPSHGHPLGVTRNLIEAEHKRMKMIYRRGRDVVADLVLTGEGNGECFNDIVSNKLIHYELWPGHVPLFAAVYHDYVTAYGRTATLISQNADDPMPAMRIGWQLALGNQIGRIWGGAIHARYDNRPYYAAHRDYLVRAAALRQLFPEFLCVGRMLRPPYVDGELPTVTTHEFRKLDGRVTLPAVVGSTWRSIDGDQAVLLTNMSREPVTLVFWLRDDEFEGTLRRAYADSYMADDVVLGRLVRHITLPPLGIAFYKLDP